MTLREEQEEYSARHAARLRARVAELEIELATYRTGQLVPLPEVEELAKVLAWGRAKRFFEEVTDVGQIKDVIVTFADEEDATALINHMKGKTDG